MGTTTSRPILYSVESFLLQIAHIIDTGIRFVERLLSSLYSLCIPTSFYHSFDGNGATIRACDEQGVCYIPATRMKQHQKMKQQRDDRLKRRKVRAEWAAAGLDVDEMEKQEMVKKKRQQSQTPNRSSVDVDALQHDARMSLGDVARAPPLRPELERETRAERERGRLWVLGNVAPPHAPSLATRTFDEKTIEKSKSPLESQYAPLESVKETSHHDLAEYAVQGHGNRLTKRGSEHGDISYQIVATSNDVSHRLKVSPSRPARVQASMMSQGIMPAQASPVAVATSASRLGVAESRPSHKANAASLPTLSFAAASEKTGPTISQPTLIRPAAQRLRQSLDLSPSAKEMRAVEVRGKAKKDPIDLRSDSPRFFNRARASLDLATTAASQISRPSSPGSPAGIISSASSDAGSITSKRSLFGGTISRASTPPCVSELANRACKSRWEANAKERKGWKDEIDAMALHRLHRASRRSRQEAHIIKKGGGRTTTAGIACVESRLRSSVSDASQVTNLALVAEKKLRRASVEPKHTAVARTNSSGKTNAKVKRRPSQKT